MPVVKSPVPDTRPSLILRLPDARDVEAWEELAWQGRLRIGGVPFEVTRAKTRCLATHANPASGERDLPVLTTLTRAFGQEEPTFATSLRALEPGTISLGDPVELL